MKHLNTTLALALWGLALAALPAVADTPASQTDRNDLGRAHFETSCSPAADARFQRALLQLHSFDHSNVDAFAEAVKLDPDCAIAYWGIAMGERRNPLVGRFSHEQLQRGVAAIRKGLSIGPKSERERDWMTAIAAYYQDDKSIPLQARRSAYGQAMERLWRKYPGDPEAAVFYALSLLESAELSDKTYANQIKAGRILEEIWAQWPDHPGAAHYLVHAYDFAPLALRGRPAADKYAAIAPASVHAQHMPSHIYSMLGLWEESIRSNRASVAAAKEVTDRHAPHKVHGHTAHNWDFMIYAYLQLGQVENARHIRDQARDTDQLFGEALGVYTGLAAAEARFALERHDWQEAMELEPRGTKYAPAEAITYFVRALGRARGGDPATARSDIRQLEALKADLETEHQPYWAEQTEIQILAAQAWVALAEGRQEAALAGMRRAADLEDRSEKHVAMENRLYPMRELLGEMLLEVGRNGAALTELERSIRTVPNRLRAFYGAALAAARSGDQQKATRYYRQLLELARDSDPGKPEIEAAKQYIARQ